MNNEKILKRLTHSSFEYSTQAWIIVWANLEDFHLVNLFYFAVNKLITVKTTF